MNKTLEQIAEALAIDAKASGFDCMGDLYCKDDHGHLTAAEWNKVCDMAEEMKPNVTVPDDVMQAWADATCNVYAEEQAERRAFGY